MCLCSIERACAHIEIHRRTHGRNRANGERRRRPGAEFSRQAGLIRYDVVRWERDLSLDGGVVSRDRRQAHSGVSELPFVSVPLEELSRHGLGHDRVPHIALRRVDTAIP